MSPCFPERGRPKLRLVQWALFGLSIAGALVACSVGAAAASGPEAGKSVVKGKTAPISEFPWLANITYEGPIDRFGCTGSVVAPRLVLTAAHCVLSASGHIQTPGGFRVTTGLSDLKQASPENTSRVVEALVAPGYSVPTLRPDAALLVLEAPVAAPPILLAGPADTELYAPGTPLVIAGWGLTDERATQTPSVLREGPTVIQSQGYCNRKIKRIAPSYNASAQLCALSTPKREVSSCNGDSGGPSIALKSNGTAVQVGLISYGVSGCDPRTPEVHTRVDAVSEWITQWISAVELGTPCLFRAYLACQS